MDGPASKGITDDFNFVMLLVIACCLQIIAHQTPAVILETIASTSAKEEEGLKRPRKRDCMSELTTYKIWKRFYDNFKRTLTP